MTPISRTSRLLVVTVVGASLLITSCSGSGKKSTKPTASSTVASPTTSAPTTTAPATPTPAVATGNPFTGIGPVPTTPTIAVKIDDTLGGRPQVGIEKADIVYVEAAEAGLTRLAAVFGTYKPTEVGYVRSTRPSDPDLLLQFGKITEAYSGGAHDSLPRVEHSGITSWSNDAHAPYYRRAPHANDHGYINLVLNLAEVAKHVKTPRPKNIGWTFSASLAGLTATAATDVRTSVSGSYSAAQGTQVEFRYDATLKKYVRYIGGVRQLAADGKPVAMTNVIVQSCKVVAHPEDTDVNFNPSQFTTTTGSGPVQVFRQGKRVVGTWSRPTLADGTVLRTAAGKAIPLDPGNTWVVLIRKGIAVQP